MDKKTRVLVTGANGFLGVNTIIELINQGYHVTGFLRDKNKFALNEHDKLKLVEGNILNPDDLNKALFECKYVIHTAAIINPRLLKYSEYEKANVEGTKNVLEAAIKVKVKKLIYVSTANVFGYGSLNDLGNETKQMMRPFSKSFYAISKKTAQDSVLSMKTEIEVVTVNPTFMIGAYGGKLGSNRIVYTGLKKRIILCPPGGKSFVCVKDVSLGIVKALKKGLNGEAYLLSNENLSFKEFFNLLRKQTKSKPIIVSIPKFFLLLIGYLGDFAGYFGVNTHFCIENMKILCTNNYYSNNKAKIHLGATFNSIEKGISDALLWFAENDKIL